MAPSTRRWHLAIAALALALSVAPIVTAQPDDKAAETLFREGREALQKEDFTTACAKFSASLALVRRPSTLLNLAQCEEHENHLVEALGHWREAIPLLDPKDDRVAIGKERTVSLERRIPQITVKLDASAPPDVVVTLDGKPLDRSAIGSTIPLDAGEHTVVVTAPDRLEMKSIVKLVENERREVTLTAGAMKPTAGPTATAAPTAASPPPASGGLRTAGFVVAGVGVVGLAAFGITGALAASKDATIKSECPNKQCTAAGIDAVNANKTMLVVNAVALGVGVVGAGVGVTLIVLGGPKKGAAVEGGGPSARLETTGLGARVLGTF